jgi:ATP-dependent RNA helicase DeaD
LDTDNPTFADLGLDPRIVSAVEDLGFKTPTEIQVAAVPVLLEGRHVMGGARTGSGKTAAFGLPMVHRLQGQAKHVRGLILVPTRELAQQVSQAIRTFAAKMPDVRTVAVYGGAPYRPQLDALRRGVTLVVGTPGRLIDHLERGSLDLSQVEMVVLDEADEMLRMGFLEDVETLLNATPDTRQVALFSASLPDRIQQMASSYLVDPVEARVDEATLSVDHIVQSWMLVPFRHKVDALVRVLRAERRDAALVFVRTRKACAEVADELAHRGLAVDGLHGDMQQAARERVLDRLRSGHLGVVIATDVAARGIDVDHISHVVNFDLPDDVASYVHRIGRTGRAGRAGRAISFVTPRERRRVKRFQQVLGVSIPKEQVASDAQIALRTRRALWQDLIDRHAEAGLEDVTDWLDQTLEKHEVELKDVAATALAMLAEERGAVFEQLSDAPPSWAKPPRREPEGRGPGRPGGQGGQGGPRGADHGWTDLFLPIGRRRGVRPGDVVGALTHGAGLNGSQVGRITIFDHKTFVGVAAPIVQPLLERVHTVQVRGMDVPLRRARVHGSGKK